MATRAKFARLDHYSREFGDASQKWRMFVSLASPWKTSWRMLASLASLAYFRKTQFWQMQILTKSAEILASTCTRKICTRVAIAYL
jgi:hypothetical protein